MKGCWLVFVNVLFFAYLPSLLCLNKCTENQLTYQFTECDSAEGRWRVAVPKDPTVCEASEVPVRQKDCTYTCDPGHYVDVTSKTLECKVCPKGTYSVGGGVRFSSWVTLPTGFESRVTGAHYQGYDYDSEYFTAKESKNCSKTGWTPKGDSISSSGDECTSELSYAVTLQKDGYVSFTYYYTDEIYTVFRVFVRNEQCKVSHLDRDQTFITRSVNNEWRTKKISLKAGRNVIIWQATAITYSDDSGSSNPVFIKDIEIQGVSYTSDCTPCDAGFFNNQEGRGSCTMCSANTFSAAGATECSKCNELTEYAGRGAKNCTLREPCTEQDYYEIHTACDSEHKTQVKYQWIQPKICRDDIQGAKQLPASGAKEDCPPCNPGMHVNGTGGSCAFCPVNYFSNGTVDCKECPVSTEPVYGYHFKWWREIPAELHPSCFSMSDRGCTSKQGWQPRGVFLDSGLHQADDVFMRLHITVNGFGSHEGLASSKPGQHGEISFIFEMICDDDCVFKFQEKAKYKGITEIASWKGNNGKMKYSYLIFSQASTEFIWTFQKHKTYSYDNVLSQSSNDRVKIYAITINNTIDGGADHCRECPVTSSEKGCISCPKGNYIDSSQHKCIPCPKGTYLNTSNPYGLKSCIKCGPGLTSNGGSTVCHSSCFFDSKKHKRTFDLSGLKGPHSVAGAPSFTSRGFKYYHLFNMNLCGDKYEEAVCSSNISLSTGKSQLYNLTAPVCRMTVIPEATRVITTQSMSLAERLVGIYEDVDENSTEPSVFSEEGGPVTNKSSFFLFKFHSGSITQACPNGRSVWVTVLCDVTAAGKGHLDLPTKCPDGTCDGCRFEMLLRTKYACPVCVKSDYTEVQSSCVAGNKTTTYVWNEPKLCRDGVKKPPSKTTECSILERSIGAAMKDFKIGIGVIAALIVLMILTMFGLWYKNRKLTYKYHRLVQNNSDKPGELPAVERCVVDEDEEDEEEVQFKIGQDRGKKILKKIRDIAGGGKRKEKVTFDDEDDDYFESVHLESGKEAYSEEFN